MRTTTTRIFMLWLTACPASETTTAAGDTGGSSGTAAEPPASASAPLPTTGGSSGSSGAPAESSGADATGETSTGTGDADGTTAASLCGDGIVDPDEQCDLGVDNADIGYCKTDCTTATCGDGLVWAGVEQCDAGPGGNTGQYGGCAHNCTLAAFCGDGELHPSEGCDAGALNGTGSGEDGFVPCSATCDLEARRVFVSSATYAGNLGGLGGADEICEGLVAAAGWKQPRKLRAWLSDAAESPLTRLHEADPPLPYALVNGRRIAGSLAELIALGPGDGIDLDEHGEPRSLVRVWTNTGPGGEALSKVDHCGGWVSMSPQLLARVGLNAVPKEPETEWTQWAELKMWTSQATMKCQFSYHLYCLED